MPATLEIQPLVSTLRTPKPSAMWMLPAGSTANSKGTIASAVAGPSTSSLEPPPASVVMMPAESIRRIRRPSATSTLRAPSTAIAYGSTHAAVAGTPSPLGPSTGPTPANVVMTPWGSTRKIFFAVGSEM